MKVSILSAVHNEAQYIQAMIDSVLAQTHQDWEILFVSDGSTDETENLILQNAKADSRIQLVGDGKKIGKVAAFNLAMRYSAGDVIILLAGDDTLPPDSLAMRIHPLEKWSLTHPDKAAATFCKLKTMSEEPKLDGQILPRGKSAAHSGGTIAMNRYAASVAFPIPETLVSEDLWLTRAVESLSEHIADIPVPGLEYRIHENNSNPRRQSFAEMSAAMSARHRAWEELLNSSQITFDAQARKDLVTQRDLEFLRRRSALLSILFYPSASIVERLAYLSMANARLYSIRSRYYTLLSGWRGR
ncbi:glycosyltransferase [Dietzia sp. ANT_WB102]|uniref:glycosyltransferase family 2 protein n=1 Tax=Dietzia sp. ANT_WB102 TaxID=2597345 RepID=UPI00165D3AA1|nr:glycosyltransferase [Dietzia sp. ANT_WB102]